MRFISAIMGLAAIAKAMSDGDTHSIDTTSPYEKDYLTSAKTNFTVTATKAADKSGTETVTVGYYVKKLTEKATGKSVY